MSAAQGEPGPAALRAVLDSVFSSPEYRWAEPPLLLRVLRDWWARVAHELERLQAGNPAAFRALGYTLLAALALVLAYGGWVVWRTVRGGGAPPGDAPGRRAAGARDPAWYFREADRAASEGRMADALQLAFVGLALSLERQGLLRYEASKTPAECARDARLAREDRERLRGLVRALYAHVFGGAPVGADDYRRWREDVARPWHAPAG